MNDKNQYYYRPIYWAVNNHIAEGYEQKLFGIDNECTVKQFLLFLWKMSGKPDADLTTLKDCLDISLDDRGNTALAWAVNSGLVDPSLDGMLHPNNVLTRKQAAVILYKFAGSPYTDDELDYIDLGEEMLVDDCAAIKWSTNNNLISGYQDRTFRPDEPCVRKQAITFLYRFHELQSANNENGLPENK